MKDAKPIKKDDKRFYAPTRLSNDRVVRGAWAELIACAWLLEKGFAVFRNVTSRGHIDIVIGVDARFVGIDVKLTEVDLKNPSKPALIRGNSLTDIQDNAGIIQLYVTPDGVCSFDRVQLANLYREAGKKAREEALKNRLDPDATVVRCS